MCPTVFLSCFIIIIMEICKARTLRFKAADMYRYQIPPPPPPPKKKEVLFRSFEKKKKKKRGGLARKFALALYCHVKLAFFLTGFVFGSFGNEV